MIEVRPETSVHRVDAAPVVIPDRCNCPGESIVWDDREHLMYWVNIHESEVWQQ
jgi:hypothetical protein